MKLGNPGFSLLLLLGLSFVVPLAAAEAVSVELHDDHHEGPLSSHTAEEVWHTLDRKPSLEVLLARYPVPSPVQAAMRAALCQATCQATLSNTQHLQECTILVWEMFDLLGCRAECLDSVGIGCEVLQSGLKPAGMTLKTKTCTSKQYRTFFKRYQHGNLGGGLLQDLYETVGGRGWSTIPERLLHTACLATTIYLLHY